jgi:hypothetical protein
VGALSRPWTLSAPSGQEDEMSQTEAYHLNVKAVDKVRRHNTRFHRELHQHITKVAQ